MEKLFQDPFLKIQNWAYLWIINLKFYTVCFYSMSSWGLSKYIFKLSCTPLAFTSFKASLKNKKDIELVSLPDFLHYFSRIMFLLLYPINLPNFIVWLPLLREILDNVCMAMVCWPVYHLTIFEINHIFLIKSFFPQDQKFKT